MRRRVGAAGSLVLAGLCACVAACLPRGDPPTGRQVIADRTSLLADVLPAMPDGTLRLVVARARPEPYLADLYLVSVPADGTAPTERLLLEEASWSLGCPASPCLPTDARGRLFLYTRPDPMNGFTSVVRVDPASGERTDFGPASDYRLSPSKERVFVAAYSDTGMPTYTLHEADDRRFELPLASSPAFVGDDLFYVGAGATLMRVRPGAAPESVRTNISGFYAVNIEAGPRLFLLATGDDPNVLLTSIVDPATFEDLFPPFRGGSLLALSPDGRWLAASKFDPSFTQQEIVLLAAGTGIEEPVEAAGDVVGSFEWRPGTNELWLQTYDNNFTVDPPMQLASLSIKRPGMPARQLPLSITTYWAGFAAQSVFTRDGRHWFSQRPSQAQHRFTMMVGSADDPTAPLIDLHPEGTGSIRHVELADGRLLIESFRTGPERSNINAVDPATGRATLLGELGMALAVGERRVLANLHIVDGAGSLTAIDPETARATTLAAEFMTTALVEPAAAGADRLAPGARVAYRFRARFDSPYDGIWVATLP